MPANLNALIRYKTINSCLFGGKRRWSVDELRERCSEALAEDRGRYAGVSERTIRDDIRVMRSDILGFNAPIKQEGGLYFYSDPGYSILSIRITDAGLAKQILVLLQKLRGKVNHPEMEIIMEKLSMLIGREPETEEVFKATYENREALILPDEIHATDVEDHYDKKIACRRFTGLKSFRSSRFRLLMNDLLWGEILIRFAKK